MAKNIQGKNPEAKALKIRKRLRRRLNQLSTADSLTAGQRDQLFVACLQDLYKLELFKLGDLREDD